MKFRGRFRRHLLAQPRTAGIFWGGVFGALLGWLAIDLLSLAGEDGLPGIPGWQFGLLVGMYVGFMLGRQIARRPNWPD